MRLTWKSTLVLAAVIGLIAFFGALVAQKAWAQAKGPADFDFDGKGSGKVVFSHEKHAAKSPKCTDCHTKVATAPMKTKTQAAFHDPMAKKGVCVDCHLAENAKGKKAPTSKCADCHKKEHV